MTEAFDYAAPAELFSANTKGFRRSFVAYKRFDSAAAAIKYAIEDLSPETLAGAVLEIEEARFDKSEMIALYASSDYPLQRSRQITAALRVSEPETES